MTTTTLTPDAVRDVLRKVKDPELDGWLDQARTSTNLDERKKLYAQVQQRINETLPIVLLVRREWGDAAWNDVKSYARYPGLAWHGERAAEWWLDR